MEAIHALMAREGGSGSRRDGPGMGKDWRTEGERRQRRDHRRDEQWTASHAADWWAEWACGRCGQRNFLDKTSCRCRGEPFAAEVDLVHGLHPAPHVAFGPPMSGGQETQAEPMSVSLHRGLHPLSCTPPGQVSPGRPHGQPPMAHGDLQKAVPRAAVGASAGAPSAAVNPVSATDIQASEKALAAASDLDVIRAMEQKLVGIWAAKEHKQKLLVERCRQAQKRADHMKKELSLAQEALAQAQENHRLAREEAAWAETALSSAAEVVAVLCAKEDAAHLVTTMLHMVEANRAGNMFDLPVPEADHDKNAGNSETPMVLENDDEDMQAAERLPALREQRGRSRTPPPRGTSVAELADRLEDEA